MAATDIAMYNQAMIKLRAGTITAFNDGSNEADIGNILYTPAVKSLLTMHAWSFALKKATFSSTTAPVNEYTYAHTVPSEALLVWAIYNSDAAGARPITDYRIFGQGSSREIFSNHSTIYGDYTYYTDEANWPPYFEEFASVYLAAKHAKAITGSTDFQNNLMEEAFGTPSEGGKGGLFAIAVATDAKQQSPEVIIDSPFVSARFA